MVREELEATEWAKEFKLQSPILYEEALRFVTKPDVRVELCCTDETGERVWAISVVELDGNSTGFWLDAKKTKKEATHLCRRMGWKIVRKS